jgi:hypothetical protein
MLVVAATIAAVVGAWGTRPATDLTFANGMPEDLRHLTRVTWERFTRAFPARRDCLAPVMVDGVWELDDRATYEPGPRLVSVRIPGSAPNLEASLVHEFAHHLEFTCPEHRRLRSSFLAAQGSPKNAPWFEGRTWGSTPSEQFAEATTEFVLGRRPAHARIDVSRAAVRVIGSWAVGD